MLFAPWDLVTEYSFPVPVFVPGGFKKKCCYVSPNQVRICVNGSFLPYHLQKTDLIYFSTKIYIVLIFNFQYISIGIIIIDGPIISER